MKFTKILLTTSVILGLTACSSFHDHQEIETLDKTAAVGSPFTQQLTAEYKAFSDFELKNEEDYADALHFSRKGLASAEGTVVMPEPVHDWMLTEGDIVDLSNGYNRLISAFDRGAREVLPGKTAIAQARYDCWIEEQEEVAKGAPSSVPCKADFLAAMDEIEAALPVVAAPAPVVEEFPAPVTILDSDEDLNVAEASYLIFFDFDSSTVNQGGLSVVDTVVQEVVSRNINTVNIVGHTDTSGSAAYNAKLANKRAQSVKDSLVARGVAANVISIDGRGENELLVNTQDGIREPANRRAVITFQ